MDQHFVTPTGLSSRDLPNQLPREPQERFLEVIVRLRRDFEVLNVLLSVECDLCGLNFALLRGE